MICFFQSLFTTKGCFSQLKTNEKIKTNISGKNKEEKSSYDDDDAC